MFDSIFALFGKTARTGTKIVGFASIAVGLLVGYLSLYNVVSAVIAYANCAPVKVTMGEDVGLEQSGSGASVMYIPHANYAYTVNGAHYLNDRIGLFEIGSEDREAMHQLIAVYKVNGVYPGWYATYNPWVSFLIKRIPILPIVFAMVGAYLVGIGLFLLLNLDVEHQFESEYDQESGWYKVDQKTDPVRHTMAYAAYLWVVGGVSLLVLPVYFQYGQNYSPLATVLVACSSISCLIAAICICWELSSMSKFPTAEIQFDTSQALPGEPFTARIRQHVNRSITVRSIDIGLICHRTRVYEVWVYNPNLRRDVKKQDSESKVESEQWVRAGENLKYNAGQTIQIEQPLVVPSNADEAALTDGISITYDWEIVFKLKLDSLKSYRVAFPLPSQENFKKDSRGHAIL